MFLISACQWASLWMRSHQLYGEDSWWWVQLKSCCVKWHGMQLTTLWWTHLLEQGTLTSLLSRICHWQVQNTLLVRSVSEVYHQHSINGTCKWSLLAKHIIMWDADKSLAWAGRKQATASKLGFYSTYSPRSSIHFLARCSNFYKPFKKNL